MDLRLRVKLRPVKLLKFILTIDISGQPTFLQLPPEPDRYRNICKLYGVYNTTIHYIF